MIGALAGDIIGRPYEMVNWKSKRFPLFNKNCKPTDDGILTLAVADAFMHSEKDLHTTLQDYYHWYPNAGYGMGFKLWAMDRIEDQISSEGNGAAMRVSPVAYIGTTMSDVLSMAAKSVQPSHNSLGAMRGAKAIAGSVYLARIGCVKDEIKEFVERDYYDLSFDYDELVEHYTDEGRWGYTCDKSVPQAIYCFLISTSFEDCIRTAISIGGDSDTIADMAGAIAEPFYKGVPAPILKNVLSYFENDERLITVIREFNKKFLKFNYEI